MGNQDHNLTERIATAIGGSLEELAVELAAEQQSWVDENHLLNAAQIAEVLNVPENWIREKTATCEIPCVHLGKYRRYHPPTIKAWMLENTDFGTSKGSVRPAVPR